jgi:hypothetical protein
LVRLVDPRAAMGLATALGASIALVAAITARRGASWQ